MTGSYRELVAGLQVSAPWRSVFAAVDRRTFIPAQIWDDTNPEMIAVSRDTYPDWWQRLVYRDDAVITQVEDGVATDDPWLKSSSSSAPSIVALMLDRLQVAPNHHVLEIGTGTGWNAALLATRLGDDQVVSLEVDPVIADHARKALANAGRTPAVITGDGALGYPAGAPYDRIIATAAIQKVPAPWVQQVRPGGRIIAPWGTPYENGALLELTAQLDGSAVGRFTERVGFMWLRAQREARGAVEDVVHPHHNYTERISPLHPWDPIGDADGRFATGLRVPHCKFVVVHDEDGQDNHFVAYLLDPDGGSWASVHVEPDMTNQIPVRQHGQRRLWDEVEQAHRWWNMAGRPEFDRFGVKVRPDGQQWVFLDVPERLVA